MDERQKDKSDLEMQVAMLEKEIADLKQQLTCIRLWESSKNPYADACT